MLRTSKRSIFFQYHVLQPRIARAMSELSTTSKNRDKCCCRPCEGPPKKRSDLSNHCLCYKYDIQVFLYKCSIYSTLLAGFVCMYTYIYIHVYNRVYIYIYIYNRVCTYIYIYIQSIYIYIFICMFFSYTRQIMPESKYPDLHLILNRSSKVSMEQF